MEPSAATSNPLLDIINSNSSATSDNLPDPKQYYALKNRLVHDEVICNLNGDTNGLKRIHEQEMENDINIQTAQANLRALEKQTADSQNNIESAFPNLGDADAPTSQNAPYAFGMAPDDTSNNPLLDIINSDPTASE